MNAAIEMVFGSNTRFEFIGLVIGLIALVIDSQDYLILGFGVIAISMFYNLVLNSAKYYTILKLEKVFGVKKK